MSYWLIELVGDKKSLDFLSDYVATDEISIIEEQEKTYIKVANLADGDAETLSGSLQNAKNVEYMEKMIEIINGATTLFWPEFKKPTFGDTIKVKDDGKRLIYRTLHASVVSTTVYSFKKGSQTLSKWISLSKNNSLVYKVFYLYSVVGKNWIGFYMVLEVIVDDLGGTWDEIVKQGWVSKTELSMFKQTANSYGAVGHSARHASTKTLPPKKPMNIQEARKLVDSIVTQWLSSKI